MKNPLHDKNFLRKLDLSRHHFVYAKITVLDFNELPKEEITGRVTTGSISVDGSSVVRRTCSLTLVAKDVNMSDYLWGLNSKFKLEVGLENNIDPQYPDIIWFKQGIFLITSYNCSVSLNNYTISIQGKDKMSLLNGDIGGVITQLAVNFSDEDIVEYDAVGGATITTKKVPIKNIILNAVHEWAKEPWYNIVVNDLNDYGLELLEYQGDNPVYLTITRDVRSVDSGTREVQNIYTDQNVQICFPIDTNDRFPISSLEEMGGTYDALLEESSIGREFQRDVSVIYLADDVERGNPVEYTVFKGEKGSVMGYRLTDITYPGDLILSAGSTLTQMLDKLVQMLGNFEYFYDLDGRFVFQKKKTYVDVSWNSINGEHDFSTTTYAQDAVNVSKEVYRFEDDYLLSSFQNTPNLSNLKNDFTIYGNKDVNGVKVPIHLRYAIDHKPLMYKPIGYTELTDYDKDLGCLIHKTIDCNWVGTYWYFDTKEKEDEALKFWNKEIQGEYISKDYLVNNGIRNEDPDIPEEEKILYCIESSTGGYVEVNWADKNNPFYETSGRKIYKKIINVELEGEKGKEKPKPYSIVFLSDKDVSYEQKPGEDIVVFVVDWRELIFQMAMDYRQHNRDQDFLFQITNNNKNAEGISYYPTGYTGYEQYYIDFETGSKKEVNLTTVDGLSFKETRTISFWREIYNPCLSIKGHFISKLDNVWKNIYDYGTSGWRKDLSENPQLVHFWFDFLDSYGEINRYAVPNIGDRSKVVNDNNIKAIYYREIPNVIYRMSTENISEDYNEEWTKPGYVYLQVGLGYEGLFNISTQGKSAIDLLEEWLNDYTYCTESVSFSSVPIYYLEPNTIAIIKDNETGLSGQYIIKQFTIPLGIGSQMSVTATKIIDSSVSSLLGGETVSIPVTSIDVSKSDPSTLEILNPQWIVTVKKNPESSGFELHIDQKKSPKDREEDIRIADNRAGEGQEQPAIGSLHIRNVSTSDVGDKGVEDASKKIIDNFFDTKHYYKEDDE